MATGGLAGIVDKGSDIISDYLCSCCKAQGSHTEATHFCIDCEERLCHKCLEHHNSSVEKSAHEVLDKTAMAASDLQQNRSRPMEKTDEDPNQATDKLCTECDSLALRDPFNCLYIGHRSCEAITYVLKAETSEQKRLASDHIKSTIPPIQKQLGATKKAMELEHNAIDEEGENILKQIKSFRRLLDRKLDDLDNKVSDLVKNKTQSDKDKVMENMRRIEDITSKLDCNFETFKTTTCEKQSHLSAHLIMGHIQNEAIALFDYLNTEPERFQLEFKKSNALEEYVNNLSSIGKVVRHANGVTSLCPCEINVKVKEDMNSCDINSICQMDNGTMLITDRLNQKIKRLSSSYTVRDFCGLPGQPSAVCTTDTDEVAVALNSKTVEFVSVRNMTLVKSFDLDFEPRGIASNAGKLYITRIAGLVIYSNAGSLLKTIEQDTPGQYIIPWPRHLNISEDQTTVMVADEIKGIVTRDLQGDRISCFSDRELEGARGVSNGMNGTFFAAGYFSNNIIQFNSKGGMLGVVLREKDGIQRPYTVCWDRINLMLVVVMEDTDYIKVYDIM